MFNKQDLFKGTLFEGVTQLYTLKIPSKKSFSKKLIPKIETLALSFYSHIFAKTIQTHYKNTILENYPQTTQTVREAYTNFFYSLSTKSQKNLDFIACLISLLIQVIISGEKLQSDKKIQQFIESLNKNDQRLRDQMYILYTFETLACKVSKESAKLLFDRYIVCENCVNETNIGTRLKLDIQLKKVKENLEKNNQHVFIRPRIRKIGRQKNLEQELKSLMEQNRIQIEQQNKKNIKFHKYINKCMTEGTIEFNHELLKKSSKVMKISSFLKTVKNLQDLTKSKKSKRMKKNENYNQKGSKYWFSVVKSIRDDQFLNKREKMQALSNLNDGQMFRNSEQLTCIQPEQKFISRIEKLSLEEIDDKKKQRSMNNKKTNIQFNNILPDIKEYMTPLYKNSTLSASPIKSTHLNSRRLKKQLQNFLNTQNSKRY